MFVHAIESAVQFTRPIHTLSRMYGSTDVHPGAATLFFINADGWALTCAHVARHLVAAEKVSTQYQAFKAEASQLGTSKKKRLIFHGAVVLLVGLLCGLPTVVETSTGSARFWHTAHEALVMMGIWMLAASSVLPALVLERREMWGFVWSLLVMGYGFMMALVIGGIVGANAFAPGGTPATFTAFLGAVVGILGAVVSAALTLMGARGALKAGGGG